MVKKLLSDSAIYGLSSIMARVVGFLLLPLYSNILEPADYGLLGLYNSLFYFLFVLLVFGMDSATFRFYFDNADAKQKKITTATWIWFQLALSFILLVTVYYFSEPLGQTLFHTPDGGEIIFLLSICLVLYGLPNIQEVWFRIEKRPWGAFNFAIVVTLVNLALTYYFIVVARSGFWGFIYAQIVSYGVGTLLSLFLLRNQLSPRLFQFKLLKQMLKYALPLVPAMGFYIAITWLCNYILSMHYDHAETGLFIMGNTFASILTMITGSFAQAYLPFAYSIMQQENAKQIYSIIFLFYVAGLSLLTFGYGLFALELLKVMTSPEYYGSWLVMIILAYNYFFLSITTLANIGSAIEKNSKPYSFAVLISAVVSTILFLYFIPYFGKEGAALGMLLGQLCIPIMAFYFSQRMYPIPYNFRLALHIILSSIILSALVSGIPEMKSFLLTVLLKTTLFIIYGFSLFFLLKRKFWALYLRVKPIDRSIS